MKKIVSINTVKTLSWLTVSNIIGSLAQWFLLIILVKYFTAEEVGYFTYGTALAAPVFMLFDMQLKSVLIVEPNGENDNFRTYQFIRFVTTTIATIGLITYSIIFKKINWIVFMVILYKASESLTDILNGYLQKLDKMTLMSKIGICKSLSGVIVTFIITIVVRFVTTTLVSLVIVSLCFYFIINWNINRIVSLKFKLNWQEIVGIVKKSFPLGVSVFIGSYITNYPRLTMESLLGPEQLAYYGAFSYLAIGVFQIHVPIQIYLRQRLSNNYQKSDISGFCRKISLSVLGFIALGGAVFLLFRLFGGPIVRLVYNDDYNQYRDVLYWLIVSQTILSITNVFSIAVLSFNVYTRQVFVSAAAFTAVLLFSRIFIERFGIYGGGYISIIASSISLLCYLFLFFNRLKRWKNKV